MSKVYRHNGTAGPFSEWLAQYEDGILPLRAKADAGKGSYTEYDENYNQHLEALHDLVTGKAALLDAAEDLACFVRTLSRMETEGETRKRKRCDYTWEDAVTTINNIIGQARRLAEKVPT